MRRFKLHGRRRRHWGEVQTALAALLEGRRLMYACRQSEVLWHMKKEREAALVTLIRAKRITMAYLCQRAIGRPGFSHRAMPGRRFRASAFRSHSAGRAAP